MIEKRIVGGSKRSNRPERQRALVLQGGGALGVYEVVADVLQSQLVVDTDSAKTANSDTSENVE